MKQKIKILFSVGATGASLSKGNVHFPFPVRLDSALKSYFQSEKCVQLSRSNLKNLFSLNSVALLNGKQQQKIVTPSFVLNEGLHEVEVAYFDDDDIFALNAAKPFPGPCFLKIVYEDTKLFAVWKAPGIPSNPHNANEIHTAVNAALSHFPSLNKVGRSRLEPGLVHRLDVGTSGLLLFAKTQPEFLRLQHLWKTQKVTKIYRALVVKPNAPFQETIIDFPLAHHFTSKKKMIALTGNEKFYRGNVFQAVTRVLDSRETKEGLLDITIQIDTGVTHQIRCHLSTLNIPIVGDDVYNGSPSSRLWLHAWKLIIPQSNTEETLKLTAALPQDWPC